MATETQEIVSLKTQEQYIVLLFTICMEEKNSLGMLRPLIISRKAYQLSSKQLEFRGKHILHCVVESGNIEATNLIIENTSIDLNVTDNRGDSPLHIAVKNNDQKMTEFLMLFKEVNNEIRNAQNETPLMVAAMKNNLLSLKSLLKLKDIQVNETDDNGNSALHFATLKNNIEAVQMLLADKRTDLFLENNGNDNILELAVVNGNKEMISTIISIWSEKETFGRSGPIVKGIQKAQAFGNNEIAEFIKDTVIKLPNTRMRRRVFRILRKSTAPSIEETNSPGVIDTFEKEKARILMESSEKIKKLENQLKDIQIQKQVLIEIEEKEREPPKPSSKSPPTSPRSLFRRKAPTASSSEPSKKTLVSRLGKSFKMVQIEEMEQTIIDEISRIKSERDGVIDTLNDTINQQKQFSTSRMRSPSILLLFKEPIVRTTFVGSPAMTLVGVLNILKQHSNTCSLVSKPVMGALSSPLEELGIFTWHCFKNRRYLSKPVRFVEQFEKCLKNFKKRFIIMPLGLHSLNDCKTIDTEEAHANILIYDKITNTVERFEPNGGEPITPWFEVELMDIELKKLFDQLSRQFMRQTFIKEPITYLTPIDFCPRIGFQLIQGFEEKQTKDDPGGFCAVWSLWYANLRISNPDRPRQEIVDRSIREITQSNVFQTDTPIENITAFIRNYAEFVVKKAKELSESINIPFEDFDISNPLVQQTLVRELKRFS